MPTGYKTTKLDNGALVVHDVPLMGPQKLEEKHFKNKNIDRAWMNRAIETFTKQSKIGKRPLLWDAHNTKDKAARVIGRLDNLRITEINGEDWLCADVIITDEAHQSKFLAGGSPSKSVEFQPDNHYLRGLALLDGHEGHFDYGIPDFVPEGLYEELVALGADTGFTVLCHSQAETAKGNTMTNEELLAAINAANKPLLDKLNAVEAELATVKNAKQTSTNAGDPMEEVQKIRAEAEAAANVKLSKIQRDNKIDSYAVAVSAKTKTPVSLCKKALEKGETLAHIDDIYKHLMSKADEDVKLGIEREHGDAPDLEAEFKAFKENYPENKQTFGEYKRLAKSLTSEALQSRFERHSSRGVVSVQENEQAFA